MLSARALVRTIQTSHSHQTAALLTRAARARPSTSTSSSLSRPLGPPTPPPTSLPPSTNPHVPSSLVPFTVGLASGTLGSLCGVGGAVFAIPGLVRFASLPQRTAAGCSLVAVTAIASTSAVSFAAEDHVNWPVATSLGIGAALMTPIGAAASGFARPEILRKALGAFMVLLAPIMPLRARLEERVRKEPSEKGEGKVGLLGALGGAVGLGSGLLGISGGSLFTPLIALWGEVGGFKDVLGTSFAAMVVPTAVGAVTYARMGCVARGVVAPLLGGAVAGASLGSRVALEVPEESLRWTFAALLSVLGYRILKKPIKADKAAQVVKRVAGNMGKVNTA